MRRLPRIPRRAFGQLVLNEVRLATRLPTGLVSGVGLPLVLTLIFGLLPAFKKVMPDSGGESVFAVYLPVLASFAIGALALLSLPATIVAYRDNGVLRRLATTPVSPAYVLAAQVTTNLGAAAISLILVFAIGIGVFGVPAPASVGGLLLALLLTIGALFSIGLTVGARPRSTNAVGALGAAVFFPLVFFAGLWVPRPTMPHVLETVSNYTPLGAAVEALQSAMRTGFPPGPALAVLLGYTIVCARLSGLLFVWE